MSKVSKVLEKWLPDVRWSSRDFHGPLFDIADPAVATREAVNLTFGAKKGPKKK